MAFECHDTQFESNPFSDAQPVKISQQRCDVRVLPSSNSTRVRVGRERTGTPFQFFFIKRERRFRCFFPYTPIVNCNFIESDIHQPCRTTADAIQSATDVKKWLAHVIGCIGQSVKKASRNGRIALQPFTQNFRVTSVVDQRNFIIDHM